MASTYSPLLRIQLMGTGDQVGTWGDTTNVNLGTLIEQAIAGTATFSVTGGDVTLTDIDGVSDQARCMALRITGSPSPGTTPNIIAPYTSGAPLNEPASKFYIIANGADASVVIKTAIPAITAGSTSLVVGCQYRIVSTGTTTQAEWNTIAGTSGVTYSNGSVFTAAVTGAGVGNGTAEPAGVTVPSGEVYLVYFDTTFNNFRLVGRSATSANTPNTLVLRDASGNFAAGTITATTLNTTTVNATTLNGAVNGNLAAGITATTPSTGDDTLKVATTAFVQNSIDPLVGPLSGGSSGLKTVSGDYNTVTISASVVTMSSPIVTTQVCEFGSGSTTVTLRVPNSNIKVGQRATGTNIPAQTFVSATGTATVTAGSFVNQVQYTIISLGTTDWNVVAGTTGQTYTIGQVITAVAAGSGTGTAYAYTATLSQATSGAGTNTTLTFTNMPAANTQIVFKTTGALPTGLSPNIVYFVVNPSSLGDTFGVSLTSGGSAITTSGSQSGTHSFTKLSTSGSLEMAGTLGVGFGGTGTNSLKANNLVVGNGTSAVQVIPAGTEDNVLMSVTTSTVNAGSFVIGTEYTIKTQGDTIWTAIGAANNNVGTVFTASGTGSGTGVATTNVWQSSSKNLLTVVPEKNGATLNSVSFTGIPSWVKRITVSLADIDTSGTEMVFVRVGVGGVVVTNGYTAAGVNISGSPTRSQFNTGFPIAQSISATNLYYGIYTLTKLDEINNQWVASFSGVNYSAPSGIMGGGSVGLGAGQVLDSIFIQTATLSNIFDTANINIMYE
jgi:hypothetical protein